MRSVIHRNAFAVQLNLCVMHCAIAHRLHGVATMLLIKFISFDISYLFYCITVLNFRVCLINHIYRIAH